MIIVSSFKQEYNRKKGYYSIVAAEFGNCPLCGGDLVYRNSRLRKRKNLFGELFLYLLRRLRCTTCKTLHTEIPNTIQPYKHYDSATIQCVLDGGGDASMCVADDATMRRWKSSFQEAEQDIGQRVAAVYAAEADAVVPLGSAAAILPHIRVHCINWLAFVMALLINRGGRLCTRFAFCPPPVAVKMIATGKNNRIGGRRNDKTITDTG
jgi:hypothetical protein